MAISKLFDAWTWKRSLPKPFDTVANNMRTDIYSKYNRISTKKATLHAALLSAILAGIELEVDPSGAKGALGTQNAFSVVEYPSHNAGETHVVVYNETKGKFYAGVFTGSTAPGNYYLKESGNSGAALFFALLPRLLTEDEFSAEYGALVDCRKSNYTDMAEAERAAFVLCDNVYRRIADADSLGDAGIKVNIPNTGNIQPFTQLNLDNNTYSPTSVLMGKFEYLKAGATPTSSAIFTAHADFSGKYPLSTRSFTTSESALIPKLESWYVIPEEVVKICRHAQATTSSSQPMRNFMMRGPAGTGKTEGAKAIAAGLGLPYVHITCSANTEIFDLLGQMLPEVSGMAQENVGTGELPSFDDIRFDPPTAYASLCGVYDETVTEEQVYAKLVEAIEQRAKSECEDGEKAETHQRFRYVDTPFVQAMRHGYVVELQEPSIIANPGVLVGLNSLLDRCAAITLPTGERIMRHPDTVVIVTTNNDYAGCKAMNQSVISRMNLVMDIDEPDADVLTKRVAGITGCGELHIIRKMAETVKNIAERCRETMITDGCCGVRELISWVQSYMICKNALEAAQYTVLASVSSDPENRAEILESCLQPQFS